MYSDAFSAQQHRFAATMTLFDVRNSFTKFIVALILLPFNPANFPAIGNSLSVENHAFPGYTQVRLAPGPDLEHRLSMTLNDALPNTVVVLPQGTFEFEKGLNVNVNNLVLRGQGKEAKTGTTLRFSNQIAGSYGLSASGNNFVMEDVAIEDPPGDAIIITDSNGATLRRVRVEWTKGPNRENGAYGIYPVQARNVLIEQCEVRGATDAGIYVGQSENIIIRYNRAYDNVAGIEVENSKFADIYGNEVTANTGGILVFNAPGPPILGSKHTRIFRNIVYSNNTPNFAEQGNIVGMVPAGTGIMIMAGDAIEVFENTISRNHSAGLLLASYYLRELDVGNPAYDPVPEQVYIHDNLFERNGEKPNDFMALVQHTVFGSARADLDIFYDSSGVGVRRGLQQEFPDGLSAQQAICIVNNSPGSVIASANAAAIFTPNSSFSHDISTDPADFNCTHTRVSPIVLEPPVAHTARRDTRNLVEKCTRRAEGLNMEAYISDCPKLSDYGLFDDPTNPREKANDGIPYDLSTPLFSDYTKKYRFVFLPQGLQAHYRPMEPFLFPVGTIIAKSFTIPADFRDPNSVEELIETRLLIHRTNGWKALPYIWNSDKTEAVLTTAGGIRPISWIDEKGVLHKTDYDVPSRNDCANCHGKQTLRPIGLTARSLNRLFAYENGIANQLIHWTEQGILKGVPSDARRIGKMPLWGDESANLTDRARGYLDINCGHCHAPDRAASSSGLVLRYSEPFGYTYGECKPPVAAGGGSDKLRYIIVPGRAHESILNFRVHSNESDVRMPELGRSVIHVEGAELIEDWINQMAPKDC